ncbi:MAG: hypothetical protein KAS90_01420 [Candidatus Aenigmarchaeota archaeon]|nr:hypothetical protein [Candidatus Aenigmarchaeota archaeon]
MIFIKLFFVSALLSLFLILAPAFSVLSCEVQTVCNAPNITLYRMSSLSNAHAELYT